MIEEPAPPKPFTFGKKSAIGRRRPSGHLVSLIIFAAVLLIVVLIAIAGTLVKWLWMRQLDYAGIFWTLLSVQWTMFFAAFVFAFLFLWVNFRQAIRNNADFGGVGSTGRSAFFDGTDPLGQISIGVSPRLFKLAAVVGSAVVALFFALGFQGQWDTYLRFRYGGSFGVADPLFGVDVGFYLFHLPFYELLQSTLMMLTVLALAGAVMAYMFFGVLRLSGGRNPGEPEGHVASVRASFHFGRQLGVGSVPGPLQSGLLDFGRRLRSRLYGRSCDKDRPVDHGRHLGGGVCAARVQFLPPPI